MGSLFAGVGGFDMGLEAAGFEVCWQVEIDKDAISVLERHYPTVRRYRDVREVKGSELTAVDVLVGGFPCQDLSVAGARKGLAGERSGLFFEVARIAAETATPWLLLENVPGLLSSWSPVEAPPSGLHPGARWEVDEVSDFGVVLDTLSEHGYGWTARVLDAQYFNVPQRRERVFIVGCLGDTGARAAEVLLEPESVLWDLAACLEAGERAPRVSEDGAGSGGVPSISPCLVANTDGTGASRNVGGTAYIPIVGSQGVRDALTAHGGSHGRIDAESETFVVALDGQSGATGDRVGTLGTDQGTAGGMMIANAVQASAGHHGHSSPRGDGADNLVASFHEAQITSAANRTRVEPGRPADTLNGDSRASAVIQGGCQQDQFVSPDGVTPCLAHASNTHGGNHQPKVMLGDGPSMSVRRLMPVECERLMGWPNDWTRYRADGSEIPDGPRYRLIGNGVVAPVAAWIGRRLRAALEAS